MKEIKAETFENCFEDFRELAATVCMQHEYLLDSPKVAKLLKARLQAIYDRVAKRSELIRTLQTLCRALHQHWGKIVVVLIDEYDAPLARIKQGSDYDKLIEFIENFLESGFTNDTLKFALMTGCLKNTEKSVYAGLTHVSCYGVGEDLFADKIGFTPEEVHELLCYMELPHKEEELRTWYGSYCFGTNQEIYCPWDVMKYLLALRHNPQRIPQAHWLDTSSNDVVREVLGRPDLDIDKKLVTLIQGGSIKTKLSSSLAYNAVDSSEENVWTLLYQTGYLTKTAGIQSDADSSIELRIPNKEIAEIFNDCITIRLSETFRRMDLSQFSTSFWACDEEAVTALLSQTIISGSICFDACKIEDFYHTYLECLFKKYFYNTLLRYERGHLFAANIIVKDLTNYRAAVIKVKLAKDISELTTLPYIALNQICTNKYDYQFDDNYSTILHWGIAFCQKHCVTKGITVRR